jgi:hypothetical protein
MEISRELPYICKTFLWHSRSEKRCVQAHSRLTTDNWIIWLKVCTHTYVYTHDFFFRLTDIKQMYKQLTGHFHAFWDFFLHFGISKFLCKKNSDKISGYYNYRYIYSEKFYKVLVELTKPLMTWYKSVLATFRRFVDQKNHSIRVLLRKKSEQLLNRGKNPKFLSLFWTN